MADIRDNLFGTLAIRSHFVLPEQVEQALQQQRQLEQAGQEVPRLGELLAHMGYMTPAQVRAVLQGQGTRAKGLFGEIGIQWNIITQEEVAAALNLQRETKEAGERCMRIGEFLLSRGAIRPHQIHAILQAQGKKIVSCPKCSTRYNALNIKVDRQVKCPRCQHQFIPLPSQDQPGTFQKPERTPSPESLPAVQESMRADMTVEMPAVRLLEDIAASDAVRKMVGPYQILEVLGADHSGTLFRAHDDRTDENVVLRLFSPDTMHEQEDRDRWRMAGKAATELEHLNLQRILSMDSDGGRAYLVMEYIEGQSLRQKMETVGRLPQMETIETLIQCGEALSYGHARDLIHGNLRPSHILVGTDRRIRVSGLGTPKKIHQDLRLIASQEGSSALPLYAPPEILIDEKDADERTDIYNLAAIGYHMVTGVAPQSGSDLLHVGFKAALQDILAPNALVTSMAPYLNRVLMKALQPEPEDRYGSMEDFISDLRKCRAGLLAGVEEIPEVAHDAPTGRARRLASRRRTKYRPQRQFRTYKSRGSSGKSGFGTAVGARAAGPNMGLNRSDLVNRHTPSEILLGYPEPEPLIKPDPALDPDLFDFKDPFGNTEAAQEYQAQMDEKHLRRGLIKPNFKGMRKGLVPDPALVKAQDDQKPDSKSRSARMARLQEKRPRPLEPQPRNFSELALFFFLFAFVGIIGGLFYMVSQTENGLFDDFMAAEEITIKDGVEKNQLGSEAPEEKTFTEDPVKKQAQAAAEKADKELDSLTLALTPDDFQGTVKKLDEFLQKFEKIDPRPDAVERAQQLRHKHALAGIKANLPELEKRIQELTASGGRAEATVLLNQFEKRWGKNVTSKIIQQLRAQLDSSVKESKNKDTSMVAKDSTPPSRVGEEKAADGKDAEKVASPPPPNDTPTLEGLGWKIKTGQWRLESGALLGEPQEGQDAALLQHAYEPGKIIMVEVRGKGDAAGIEFGEGRRVLIPLSTDWQAVRVEFGASGNPILYINNHARTPLEEVSKINTANMDREILLCAVGGKVEFRNFATK